MDWHKAAFDRIAEAFEFGIAISMDLIAAIGIRRIDYCKALRTNWNTAIQMKANMMEIAGIRLDFEPTYMLFFQLTAIQVDWHHKHICKAIAGMFGGLGIRGKRNPFQFPDQLLLELE